MNAPFKQDGRMGRFHCNLGPDTLVLLRFSGTDHYSDLFEYRVEALSVDPEIDLDSLLGTHGRVALLDRKLEPIWFDGIITDIVWAGPAENGHRYDLTLRPWFALAELRRNQRIFHEMTAPQILEELLAPYSSLGQPHLENRLTGSYPTLEYTVQYRESDLQFASRLMERFGIGYAFRHEEGNHTMILLDSVDEHPEVPGGSRRYLGFSGHHQSEEEHFWEFLPRRSITTGAIRLTDYNFKTPTASMEVDHADPAPHPEGDSESFDYPGDYLDAGDGRNRVATLRVRQERTRDKAVHAEGDTVSLKSGQRVALTGQHLPSVMTDAYVALSASHSYTSDSYGSGGAAAGTDAFRGSYLLQPVTAPLVPVRRTPQPTIQGPQTAMVVGEGEIDCDEYGRILVRFHWDLKQAISMRCRVSQSWASKGWGGLVIPRVGMEVVVEFIEGDPDRPLVTGCVYNGRNMAAYPLPEHKTKSVFRSDTHQGSGFNEIVFEDEKGRENIATKAEQDLSTLVENDRLERVKRHDVTSVGRNRVVDIGKNYKTEVGESMNLTVGMTGAMAKMKVMAQTLLFANTQGLLKKGGSGGKFAGDVGKSEFGWIDSGGDRGLNGLRSASEAGKDANHAMRNSGSSLGKSADTIMGTKGTLHTVVEKYRSDYTGEASAEQVGKVKVLNVGGKYMENTAKEKHQTIGMKLMQTVGKLILSKTTKHTIVATQKITLTTPGASIELDSSGLKISAFQVKVLSPSVDFMPGAPNPAEALAAVADIAAVGISPSSV